MIHDGYEFAGYGFPSQPGTYTYRYGEPTSDTRCRNCNLRVAYTYFALVNGVFGSLFAECANCAPKFCQDGPFGPVAKVS